MIIQIEAFVKQCCSLNINKYAERNYVVKKIYFLGVPKITKEVLAKLMINNQLEEIKVRKTENI